MKLNRIQKMAVISLLGFVLSAFFIAELEIDPFHMFEVESERMREYIGIRKSKMTKLERKGEADWLRQ
jgi:hypothetical protein